MDRFEGVYMILFCSLREREINIVWLKGRRRGGEDRKTKREEAGRKDEEGRSRRTGRGKRRETEKK